MFPTERERANVDATGRGHPAESAIIKDIHNTMRNNSPHIAITMGDPTGVGPEVIVKAVNAPEVRECCLPVVIGDPLAMKRAIELLGADLDIIAMEHLTEDIPWEAKSIPVVAPGGLLAPSDIEYGRPSASACKATVRYIETAVSMALEGIADGITTAPINKANLHKHGFNFPGHTEFLQDLTGAPQVVMMLAGPRLRITLATIHEAIADVPALLDAAHLHTVIRITAETMIRDFGLKEARIAVSALNPHAGEEGRFGREEIDLIGPVVDSFRATPYHVSGPYSADTLFYRAYSGEFDAVVAMYHDQGLIPIKLAHFHEAVNVSLGLPIIRTSVDHGTAYDLAGTGKANPGSMIAALRLAASMARNRSASRKDAGQP